MQSAVNVACEAAISRLQGIPGVDPKGSIFIGELEFVVFSRRPRKNYFEKGIDCRYAVAVTALLACSFNHGVIHFKVHAGNSSMINFNPFLLDAMRKQQVLPNPPQRTHFFVDEHRATEAHGLDAYCGITSLLDQATNLSGLVLDMSLDSMYSEKERCDQAMKAPFNEWVGMHAHRMRVLEGIVERGWESWITSCCLDEILKVFRFC